MDLCWASWIVPHVYDIYTTLYTHVYDVYTVLHFGSVGHCTNPGDKSYYFG